LMTVPIGGRVMAFVAVASQTVHMSPNRVRQPACGPASDN
jgi:hypothetical protein